MCKMRRLLLALTLLPLFTGSAYAADVFGKEPVRTVAIGDVTVELAGADGSSVVQIAASNGAAAGNGLYVLGGVYLSSIPTLTTGRSAAITLDVGGRALVATSGNSLSSNLAQVNGSTLSATNPVFSQLTDGASVYVGAKTSQLPSTLGQTTMASSLPVTIASNQSTLNVTQGAPTGSTWNKATVSNIAAAGTTAIVCKSGIAVSQPTKPLQYVISAPGAVRCQLRYNDNGSFTNFTDVVVTPGAATVSWSPPSGIVGLTTSATSTTQQYEANCTNFDAVAQDIGCTVVYCSAASGC